MYIILIFVDCPSSRPMAWLPWLQRVGLLHGRQQGLARPHGCEDRRGGVAPGGGGQLYSTTAR